VNPINDWPLTGEHPDWCAGFFCEHTALGYTHHSQPITLHLDDGDWELSLQRADEPGEGETQLIAVTSGVALDEPMVAHVLSRADVSLLHEHLGLIHNQAWGADIDAPVLAVAR
jgi:hypothetical protein